MRGFVVLLIGMSTLISCHEINEVSSIDPVNWNKRTVDISLSDSLNEGSTYLSVYSQIYSQSEHITHDLTATVSMRNTSSTDTLYVLNAEYFDTKGKSVRRYFNKSIYVAPLETVAIVIDEHNSEGGTGGNFIFDWKNKSGASTPLFEGVFISTKGQQGLSFTTVGTRVK